MLDLQDLLPYLFSVSLLLVLRYFYLLFLYGGLRITWIEAENYDYRNYFNPIPASRGCDSCSRLSRMVRRREAPDEDGGDCRSSFDDVYSSERGGTGRWKKQKDSFSAQKGVSFSF
ncbi:hypothetical protein [Saccharibacillus alkalitolerans]|uniref:Uncharacterized protein n=1 Tax=Saccharibacillus alkalitolerans TaxID=2705290 RepID=A0ABX0F0M0_9BACL|nr:hypothetical protein [Saccharibacillus alkalitolerans]NGZ74543.1 hypothetical protein [Saccharibacillus alkalitolerans]